MNRFSISGAIGLFLTGCTGSAVITDLAQDKVAVQATYANQNQVRAEADRGCAMHGRRAVPVSDKCLDSTCTSQSFLFACRGPLGYFGDPTPSWLGMSVDDVSGHLYAASPGSTAVVVTRIYADGPAKEAGLEVGDLVESFNGVLVRNSFTLVDLKTGIAAGERVPLRIRRGNKKLRVVIMAETTP